MTAPLRIFLATLVLYSLTASGHLHSPDEEVVFRTTRSILEDFDLAIEPLPGGFATKRGPSGGEYGQYGVGQSILALPFVAAGKLAAPLAGDAAWARLYGIPPDEPRGARGFAYTAAELAPRFFVSFFNVFVGAATAAVLLLLLRELTGDEAASFRATLLYAFASLAWAHSRPFFTESAAALFALLAWWCLLRGLRGRIEPWAAAAGASAGFAALVRMDSVLLYPGLALVLLGPIRRAVPALAPRLPAPVGAWGAFCLPALACGGVLLGINAALYGGPFATGYSDQPEGVKFSTPILAGLYGFLFSAGKGMSFFSPGLALAGFGWKRLAERDRWIAAGVATSILLPLLVMSKWQNWAGGWCWGPRHIVMIHPFLAIPIAFWFAEGLSPVRRAAFAAALAVGVAVQLLGCSQDFMAFHREFFRVPGRGYVVMYDDFDEAYWGRFYSLEENFTRAPETTRRPLGFAPAPIHHSLYLPQNSVWAGYPAMWRRGATLDNVWFRLATGRY